MRRIMTRRTRQSSQSPPQQGRIKDLPQYSNRPGNQTMQDVARKRAVARLIAVEVCSAAERVVKASEVCRQAFPRMRTAKRRMAGRAPGLRTIKDPSLRIRLQERMDEILRNAPEGSFMTRMEAYQKAWDEHQKDSRR